MWSYFRDFGGAGGPKWHFGPKKWPKMVPYRTTKSVLGSWLPQINFGWCMNHMWRYIINVRRGGAKKYKFCRKKCYFSGKSAIFGSKSTQITLESCVNDVLTYWMDIRGRGAGRYKFCWKNCHFAGKIVILPEKLPFCQKKCHFRSCTGSDGVICMSHAFFSNMF